jgi:hypothetical protein
MEEKLCKKCGETKDVSEFYRQGQGYQRVCKVCDNARRKACYEVCDKEAHALKSIKARAVFAGIPFDLDMEDIASPPVCPVLGLKLSRETGRKTNSSPSVDRIIPSLGYVKGNVQVLSELANRMKADATPEQLLLFADWVYRTYKND